MTDTLFTIGEANTVAGSWYGTGCYVEVQTVTAQHDNVVDPTGTWTWQTGSGDLATIIIEVWHEGDAPQPDVVYEGDGSGQIALVSNTARPAFLVKRGRNYAVVLSSYLDETVQTGDVLNLGDLLDQITGTETTGIDPATLTGLKAYLKDAVAAWTDQDLSDELESERNAQAARCRVPATDVPPELVKALYRRVARALALRGLPLGVQASFAEAAVALVRIGDDNEIRRLEAPYRKTSLG